MKSFFTWFVLWNKRFLQKPLYTITLFCIPLFVILLHTSMHQDDAAIRVSYFVEDGPRDESTIQFTRALKALSNHVITFNESDSENTLRTKIQRGQFACGYIIPNKLLPAIQQYEKDSMPFIQVLRSKQELTTQLVDEIVYSQLYKEIAYEILHTFLTDKGEMPGDIRTPYEDYRQGSLFFKYEYADGSTNQVLQKDDINFLLLPMRGLIAVMILLAIMIGGLFWYEDRDHNHLIWLSGARYHLVTWLYLIVPGLQTGIIGMLAIQLTGISVEASKEIPAMLLYLLACCLFVYCIRILMHRPTIFLACIPIIMAGSLIICPIFIDLTSTFPMIQHLRNLLPISFYLKAVYSHDTISSLGIYLLILSIFAIASMWFSSQKNR